VYREVVVTKVDAAKGEKKMDCESKQLWQQMQQ
jgi:hypothetical protein